MKTAFAIAAHPDDIEFLCAGTLAKYAQRGDEVFNVVCTNGDMGHVEIPPAELAEIRTQEATAAAETVGAQIKLLGEPDEWLFHDKRTRLLMIDAIRWANPDVIITHSPADYHADHRVCSEMVFAASFLSTVPHIESEHPAQDHVAALVYMDTVAAANFIPEVYVDITDTYELKKQALLCHQSQVKWLQDHDNIDVVDFIEAVARTRGLQCGVKYAEGFQVAKIWPRLRPERLLP